MLSELIESLDSDEDGTISESELTTLLEELTAEADENSDVEELFASYDADEDGSLDTEELGSLMESVLGPPPPPPDMQQAISAYGRQSEETST